MKKYYTLDDAVRRSYKNNETFIRDNNMSFTRGLYNLTRLFFGFKGKLYYFDNKKE